MNEKGLASYCQECGACVGVLDSEPSRVQEDLIESIYQEVAKALFLPSEKSCATCDKKPENGIPLGVSNRHAHLTPETFARLFGKETPIQVYRDLFQEGEFAAKQTITVVGSKMRAIQNVRILGPLRKYDQVEISLTDSIGLGVKPPIRNSGDLHDAAPLTLVGPNGSVFLDHVAIIANRHVHMTNAEAAEYGVKNGDLIKVRICGEKPTVFENVLVRTNDSWKKQLHLDTDDANAANVRCEMMVEFYGKM